MDESSRQWIDDVVAQVVQAIAPDHPGRVDPAQELVNDLAYNSLLLVELMVSLEDLFQVVQDGPEDTAAIGSVDVLQKYFRHKVDAGQAVVPTRAAVEAYLAAR